MTSVDFNAWHMPVLTVETIDALSVKPDGLYLDLTAGGGGHSAAILEKLGKNGRLYAADRDPEALKICDARLSGIETSATYKTVHASFSEFPDWLQQEELGHVDGLLADLGVSSHQLDSSARGFSYLNDGPLDMRMNPEQSSTAADILSAIPESELVALLRLYGKNATQRSLREPLSEPERKRRLTERQNWLKSSRALFLHMLGAKEIQREKRFRRCEWPSMGSNRNLHIYYMQFRM